MKTTIGLTEQVQFLPQKITVLARIDTGATKSSIDAALAKKLNLVTIDQRVVKSAHGRSLRAVVKTQIAFAHKIITGKFTVAHRKHMKYQVLIGQNMLQGKGFLIDPDKE